MQTRPASHPRFAKSFSAFIPGLGLLALALLAWVQTSQAGLIAYWDFDEGSGLTARDTSGNVNNHNGTLQGGAETPAWVPGRFGSALGFSWQSANNPAAGKRVVVPYHYELLLNGPFTISYWYRMDAPTPSGTYPGIMRIGSQSATTGTSIGWGLFRTSPFTHKRGNVSFQVSPNLTVGQWCHVVLRYDGTAGTGNNIAYFNGTQYATASANWLTATATNVVFELGRMDAFDAATLDDLALFNEAVPPARIRSLYTVPTSLPVLYKLADVRQLWAVFDGGPGSSQVVQGAAWSYTTSLPGSTTLGDAYVSGGAMYLVLGTGSGVTAPLTTLVGPVSPGGVGTPGAFTLVGSPSLVSNANVIFDLNADTTPGNGSNDLIEVTGDLAFVNSTLTIAPLAALPGGTYRLFNYAGAKTGSLLLSNTTRYTLGLDETTAGQINLAVSGSAGALKWNSTTSSNWDLTTSNWLNLGTSAGDRFFQGDAVLFDDSTTLTTNIIVSTPVFPKSLTVNATNRGYSISGPEQIGGVGNGLIKNGTNVLNLATPNTFAGPVQVNGGTLKLGHASALGSTAGPTIVAAGATLDLNAISPGAEPVTVQGAGLGGAGAVINTGAALVNNGLRGRVTLAGDTTFGGVNRWDVFGGGLSGNGFKLTKVGGNEIALASLGETGLGDVDIWGGILTFLGNSTLGDSAKTLTVYTNAVLSFWATGTTILNKAVVMNSAIMRNATGGTDVTTNLGAVTLNGDVNFQATASIALLGPVGGGGNLLKANAGTLYLGGTNTYTGRTLVSAGRLAILAGGLIANSPRIEVQSGTTFDVTRVPGAYALAANQILAGSGTVAGSLGLPAGATLMPGVENITATLSITNGLALSGGTLFCDLTASTTEGAGVNDLVNVGGNLDLTEVTTISVNPLGLLTVGNAYTVISYAGALTGSAANLAVVSNSRYTFAVNLDTPGKVIVTVTGGAAADLIWLGGTPDADNLWDLQTTPNWSDTLGTSTTFFGGDKVIFDDFGLTNIINLVGALTPATIRIENGTVDYVFQGSGKLSGASSLTKVFDAKATLANTGVNDYVGPTDIQAGTLQVGTGGTFGNLGGGPITNNGTLILNRSDNLTLANALAGSGNLIKSNANSLTLPTANLNYSGTLTMAAGTLKPGVSNALGNTTGGTVIAAGATLDVNALNLADEPVTVAGSGVGGNGAIINSSSTGQNNALRFVTLTGNTTVGGTGRWDVRANPTAALSTGGNGYSLTKIAANQISLVDAVVDPALGDIIVNAGTLSLEGGTGSGDPTKTMTVANNAVVQFYNRTLSWDKLMVLNGGQNILNGAGSTVLNGAMTLNGTITFNIGGVSLTANSPIGGSGALTKATGAGSLTLAADNTYPGATTISVGALYLGTGTNAGSVAGPIVNNGTLGIYRGDTFTLTNAITGAGSLNVRCANGLILGQSSLFFPGSVSVGLTNAGRLILPATLTAGWGNLYLGDSPNVPGEVIQLGGTLTVSNQLRVGHWPNNSSTYVMGGGTLTLPALPTGLVNSNGIAEQNGIVYLGIDGTGTFIQTGGVARAHGIVLDGRGDSPGTDTFRLEGGRFILGPSGLKSGSLDSNTSYSIQLGGGTLASSANWTSVLAMTFTGVNGNTTVDTASNTNVLTGAMAGPGGLTKIGPGVLALTGNAAYQGGTIVTQGILLVRGALGVGSNSLVMQAGTLAGDGVINDTVTIAAAATLAPGYLVGKLSVNNTVSLAGTTVMEIGKTAGRLTNDLLAVTSTLTYGGTLTVLATGDPLAGGDTFNLFDAASFAGSFTNLALPALPAGLFWDLSQLSVDGTLRVTRPPLTLSRTGSTLQITWPAEAVGYSLQVQTNAPGVGLGTNWLTVPGLTTNSFTFDLDPDLGSAFYRLIRP